MNILIDQIQTALQIATSSVSALGQVASSVETIQNVFAKPKGMKDPAVQRALAALTQQIADTLLANAQLKITLAAMHDAAVKMRTFEEQKARYEMDKTPFGNIVYRLKESHAGQDPIHYACSNCIAQDHISILQGHEGWRECPRCKTGYRFAKDSGIQTGRISRGIWDDL